MYKILTWGEMQFVHCQSFLDQLLMDKLSFYKKTLKSLQLLSFVNPNPIKTNLTYQDIWCTFSTPMKMFFKPLNPKYSI